MRSYHRFSIFPLADISHSTMKFFKNLNLVNEIAIHFKIVFDQEFSFLGHLVNSRTLLMKNFR